MNLNTLGENDIYYTPKYIWEDILIYLPIATVNTNDNSFSFR